MTWMAWTTQTAIFFIGIGIALLTMTVWELRRPTELTRGFYPWQPPAATAFLSVC